MISFESDYTTGAHPKIIEALIRTNLEQASGYGFDPYTASAARKIAEECGVPGAQIAFLVGGTQTNEIVISSMLRSYEGVMSPETGHINVHEAGAIEHLGHKVIGLPAVNGKISAEEVERCIRTHEEDESAEHMVRPGMVYITHPTELGTLYTKAELTAISKVCRKHRIPLYVDGARMAYGLASDETDVTLKDMARCADVFYIGGTKCGAFCGEALVYTGDNMPDHFLSIIKQNGALLAKGRLCGVQFDTLFTDGLYYEIGAHGVKMAKRLREILRSAGCEFYLETPTNQQFVIMPDEKVKALKEKVSFTFWEKADDTHTVVRFVTGWSTKPEDLDYLESVL